MTLNLIENYLEDMKSQPLLIANRYNENLELVCNFNYNFNIYIIYNIDQKSKMMSNNIMIL